MRAFASSPKAARQTTGSNSAKPGGQRSGQKREASSNFQLQRTIGNRAAQRLAEGNTRKVERDSTAIGARRGSGAPLPLGLRSSLEAYFDTSLERVAVHTDPRSQAAANRLNASAFTVGQDIHLGSEGVRASEAAKTALLAHEVVHTLQQGPVAVRTKTKVGAPGDAFEQQADQLAGGFSRFHRNPRDAVALRARDSMRIRRVGGDAAVIQRGRVATHFGEFEDFRYQNLTNAAGTEVGVEMYLKFHPGNDVRADLIGITQSAQGKFNGGQITSGLYGEHSATTGAGVGTFIDQLESNPNPLYATGRNVAPGGSASNLADYPTVGITALTAAQQTAQATASGITGRRFTGWGQHGYRKVVSGAFVTRPAELYDAPMLGGAGANSEQVFETAALAIAGVQDGTYYGSVEWGWRKDAAGTLSRLPLRVVSQGVPSVSFLTAANIWNQSKASFGFVSTAATDLLDASLTVLSAIPVAAELVPTGRQASGGGNTYIEVTFGGRTGFVISTAVRPAAIGAATVDLPVPMIHTVTNPAGTTMIRKTPLASLTGGPASTTLALPAGTRVTTTRCMVPTVSLPDHYQGTIVDGPHTGLEGYFLRPDLTLEALGRH